jgi:hypothetical protein
MEGYLIGFQEFYEAASKRFSTSFVTRRPNDENPQIASLSVKYDGTNIEPQGNIPLIVLPGNVCLSRPPIDRFDPFRSQLQKVVSFGTALVTETEGRLARIVRRELCESVPAEVSQDVAEVLPGSDSAATCYHGDLR